MLHCSKSRRKKKEKKKKEIKKKKIESVLLLKPLPFYIFFPTSCGWKIIWFSNQSGWVVLLMKILCKTWEGWVANWIMRLRELSSFCMCIAADTYLNTAFKCVITSHLKEVPYMHDVGRKWVHTNEGEIIWVIEYMHRAIERNIYCCLHLQRMFPKNFF